MSCCGKATNTHRGRTSLRMPFTAQEATSLAKALSGTKLNQAEWNALRHLRDKIKCSCFDSKRYQAQLCTISNNWVQLGSSNNKEEAAAITLRHLDPRYSVRVWDSEQLEFILERKGTEFYAE